jgi:hypothetical protein
MVTRLGQFSPIGRLFASGSFLKTEVAQSFGHLFPPLKFYINFDQKMWGDILACFFKNS